MWINGGTIEYEVWRGQARESFCGCVKLDLELVQPHMTQKPMLRGKVGARALRMSSQSVSGVVWQARSARRLSVSMVLCNRQRQEGFVQEASPCLSK